MNKIRLSLLLSRYTVAAILPYFVLVWLLLSVVLFVQQGSRYSDLIFNANLPDSLLWQLTIALVPNVIAFTGPIALLVGVVIGLSRMQGDSELTAMRSAGVGNLQIVVPVLMLGLVLSGFAFFINSKGVPFAAQIVRQVALKAALYKLESPVDPGIFNTEIDDLTIFVKKGDIQSGKWQNIFILQESEGKNQTRLITAQRGLIANDDENSEIVLENAQIVSIGKKNGEQEKFSIETVNKIRLKVKTKRSEIIDRLAKSKETPDEMGLRELLSFAGKQKGIERTEAYLTFQRRILLSITPLIFALLGAALVSKFNRGGRGFGMVLALASLLIYYLVTLLSEQLARTGTIPVVAAGVIPLLGSSVVISWLYFSRRRNVHEIPLYGAVERLISGLSKQRKGKGARSASVFSRAILDADIIKNVTRNYLLTLGFLTSMFIVFTAFELWKFAGTISNGVALLAAYLVYLIPFVYLQISPSALMVAAIATFVVKTRQNEVVTWAASGRSVYRLLFPCFAVAFAVGAFNFGIQELVLPVSNRMQDELRDQIRSRNDLLKRKDTYWVAGSDAIISFKQFGASDNEKNVEDLRVFRFKKDSPTLDSVVTADTAKWEGTDVSVISKGRQLEWNEAGVSRESSITGIVRLRTDPFQQSITKPTHLSLRETARKLGTVLSDSERRTYTVSMYKKYGTVFLPLVIILFTTPFSLSIHRTGNVVTIAYAAGLWLVYMGVTTIFEQMGQSGVLPASIAIASPFIIFSLIGLAMLSRIRT